jgi:hypothetical protein
MRTFKKKIVTWVLVTHACNPSYSGGRGQEDHGSKPSLGKEFHQDPISRKLITKKGMQSDLSGKSTCLETVRP